MFRACCDRPARQPYEHFSTAEDTGAGTRAIGAESSVADSTNTLVALIAVTCCLSNVAGCCCFQHLKALSSHSEYEQTQRRSFDQAGAIVARGASPDGVGRDATVIELGAPIPMLTAEPEPDEKDVDAAVKGVVTLGECERSWNLDKARFVSKSLDDVESLCTRENALLLLAAGGVSYALHETVDNNVADYTARHPNRWGKVQDLFGGIGNPPHQLAAISGLYACSLLRDDVEAHELSKSLFNAVAITEMGATLLKFAANTRRPNGDPYGWPSGHTSASFAFASVLDAYYGHLVGLPAYTVAGLVAWERIDDREHDLSDVIFGAALGYVIGRTVSNEHQSRVCGMQLEPYTDSATGSTGIVLERRF